MLFAQALEALKERKMVARKSWVEQDGYLVFLSGMNHVWKIITSPAPNAGNHIFSVNELSADDWEIVDGSNKADQPAPLNEVA